MKFHLPYFGHPSSKSRLVVLVASVLLCLAAPLPAAHSQQGCIPSLVLLANKDNRLAQVCRALLRSPDPISPAQKRPPGAGCPGPWQDGFWISSGMETPPVCGICDHASSEKSTFLLLPHYLYSSSRANWGRQASACSAALMWRPSLKRSPVKIPAAALSTGTLAYTRSEAFKSHKYTHSSFFLVRRHWTSRENSQLNISLQVITIARNS